MGEGRNSYSKTDEDTTFMRMNDDHMHNGRLKPEYNVQIAVNSKYITGIEVFSDRSDVKTLKPFLRRLEGFHQTRYEEVVVDAGCESLENCLYLGATGQTCFIKPTNYAQKKSRKFQKQIGRIENMAYYAEEDCFTCAQGRKLLLRRECTEEKDGQLVSTVWYRCESCAGCPCRAQCGRANVRAELFLPAMAFDLKKLWMKREHGRLPTRVSEKMTA